jgi:hypothetical protein
MSTATETTSMAKKQRNPASATVKIDPELLRKTKHIVLVDGGKVADYIDKLVRAAVERDYARVMRQLRERPD